MTKRRTGGAGDPATVAGAAPAAHAALRLDPARTALSDAAGRVFDPGNRRWSAAVRDTMPAAGGRGRGQRVELPAAARWLQCESGHPVRVPVAVIGPRDPTAAQYAAAEAVAHGIARMGFALICGGRAGVMEAACKGARAAGGVAIGLLPDADPACANPWASVVVATGIGEARNAIIARSALCLVAVGGSFGTLSEVAFGRQFGKIVVALEGAPRIDGVIEAASVDEALQRVAACALGLLEGGPARA